MEKSSTSRLVWIISCFTLFHIITAATLGLGDDEAYYWQWAQHLALSYYDHPPMVAYLVALTTKVVGNSPFGVRCFNIVLMPCMSVLVYRITLQIYKNQASATFALVIFNLLPIFFLGSLLIAPDTPMLFCYILGLYLFIQIIVENKSNYWYLLGGVTGLGLLSKYTMVFIYLAIFLYLIMNKDQRHWLKNRKPYLAFLLSLVIFSPVIYWNYQHHWGSFAFQFYTRHSHSLQLDGSNFFSFLGAQFLLASPVFFVAFLWVVAKNYFDRQVNLLLCFGLPSLIFFTLISLFTAAKPNWAVTAYVPLLIIFAGSGVSYIKTRFWGVVTTALLCSLVIIQAYYPIIRVKPLKNDITTDFYGWDLVAKEVDLLMQSQVQTDNWFIFSYTYQLASQLAYGLRNKYSVYSLADHIEEYYFWQDEASLLGKNGLLVINDVYQIDPSAVYKCSKWHLEKTIDIIRAGLVFRHVYLYQCLNYQGRVNPLPALTLR
jgi:undecaprenyl-diphosphatase